MKTANELLSKIQFYSHEDEYIGYTPLFDYKDGIAEHVDHLFIVGDCDTEGIPT